MLPYPFDRERLSNRRDLSADLRLRFSKAVTHDSIPERFLVPHRHANVACGVAHTLGIEIDDVAGSLGTEPVRCPSNPGQGGLVSSASTVCRSTAAPLCPLTGQTDTPAAVSEHDPEQQHSDISAPIPVVSGMERTPESSGFYIMYAMSEALVG